MFEKPPAWLLPVYHPHGLRNFRCAQRRIVIDFHSRLRYCLVSKRPFCTMGEVCHQVVPLQFPLHLDVPSPNK